MTATVFVSLAGLSWQWALGSMAITLAAWVLLAYWGSPKAKRIAVVSAVTMSLVLLDPRPVRANDTGILMEDKCEKYPFPHPYWFIYGCMLP